MLTDHDIDLGQAALAAGLINARTLARAFHDAGAQGGALALRTQLSKAGISRDDLRRLQARVRALGRIGRQATLPGSPAPLRPLPPARASLLAPDTPKVAAYDRLGLPADRFAARYTPIDELGRGGVGRVLSAEDALIGRVVAVKMLHSIDASAHQMQRFVTEAQTTAQLEHPNVVPVYDFSVLEDGAPCFTMKRVRGRSLKQVLEALANNEPDATAEYTRFRLLQIFIGVCQAMEYAHSKGVVHRDLKPDNIMLGDFGEVLVMDWGIAKILGQAEDAYDAVTPSLITETMGTIEGSIVGTPGYMAPEQARGEHERIDARTDVWALGAMLYEMLCGAFPFQDAGGTLPVLVATATREVPSARSLAPEREIPEDLDDICARALAQQPHDRFDAVKPLRASIEAVLAGTKEATRRAEEAEEQLRDGEESLWYMRMLREELTDLDAQLESLAPLSGQEAVAAKRERWAREDRVSAIRKELRRAFTFAERKLARAVELVPTDEEPRGLLADMHWRRYRDALQTLDATTAEDHLKAVARYRPADARLRRPTLSLRTTPAGAEVTLHRVVERDRLLIDAAPRVLGKTPLTAVTVPTGRSVLSIRLPHRPPVRLPIHAWQGDTLEFTVRLPSQIELGDDFIFVPGGAYIRGGDPEALLGHQATVVDVAAFAIQRLPVTCDAYFEFLNALPPHQARTHAPRDGGRLYVEPDAAGRFATPIIDRDGDAWSLDWPIFSVSFDDARAYAAWASTRDTAIYRLPTEDEWEKAARGTDGRIFPWGDHFDPTFCRMRYSLPGDLMPKPVGAFATDRSPYGVRDMAGNVREWTDSWIEEGLRTVRGGAFNHYAFTCRAASRFGYSPGRTLAGVGFRLVRVI